MHNLNSEIQTISRESGAKLTVQRDGRAPMATDHDIREVAMGFGQHFGDRTKRQDFGTTTLAEVTFRRVDPLRDPFQVADARLQTRLESLCETLRAKY
jgi:hypothetical protein